MNTKLVLSFWRKDSGNMLSHGEGLTKEQVEAFKSLKQGDRLILWANKEAGRADVTLKVYNKDFKKAPVEQTGT